MEMRSDGVLMNTVIAFASTTLEGMIVLPPSPKG
jgi:hypothetical protein